MKTQNLESGFGLIELLVSITIAALVVAGASKLFINTMVLSSSSRDSAVITGEIQSILDGYRNTSYGTLLNNFGSSYLDIANGQTVTTEITQSNGHANYSVTLTAIKNKTQSIPEAVKVQIDVIENRHHFSDLNYSYETIIASVS